MIINEQQYKTLIFTFVMWGLVRAKEVVEGNKIKLMVFCKLVEIKVTAVRFLFVLHRGKLGRGILLFIEKEKVAVDSSSGTGSRPNVWRMLLTLICADGDGTIGIRWNLS